MVDYGVRVLRIFESLNRSMMTSSKLKPCVQRNFCGKGSHQPIVAGVGDVDSVQGGRHCARVSPDYVAADGNAGIEIALSAAAVSSVAASAEELRCYAQGYGCRR